VCKESGQTLLCLSIVASFPRLDIHKERSLLAGGWTLLVCIGFHGSHAQSLVVNTKIRPVEMCFL
jgi:hypothetical protein